MLLIETVYCSRLYGNYNSVEIHNLDLKQLIKKGLAPSVTDLDLWKDQLQLMHLLARVNLYMMWCTVKMMQRVIQKIKSSKEIGFFKLTKLTVKSASEKISSNEKCLDSGIQIVLLKHWPTLLLLSTYLLCLWCVFPSKFEI